MKKAELLFLIATALVLLFAGSLQPPAAFAADETHNHHGMEHVGSAGLENAAPFKLSLAMQGSLRVGEATPVVLTLTHADTGLPVKLTELQMVHTRQLHLLVVDPSLSDYQHLHPVADNDKAGVWHVDFTPKKPGSYMVWADVTPAPFGQQAYIKAILGTPLPTRPVIDKTLNNTATRDGYTFTLHFDAPLKVGSAVLAHIVVTDKDGKPVTKLAPVMGAFSHVVGFGEALDTVLHVHPMGAMPKQAGAMGGPELTFHILPEKAGFMKLFVQTNIDGKDIFAPFGIVVQ